MRATLTKTLIEELAVDPESTTKDGRPRDVLVWDDRVTGLGIRASSGGTKSFVFQYRTPDGRDRRTTLGRYGTQLTLRQARQLAADKRLAVAAGGDPVADQQAQRALPIVRDLYERFMAEHAPKRAASTRRNYELLWQRYLLPALGSRRVLEVSWENLERLHHAMQDTPFMANRMLALASKAWGLAARWGWWPRDKANPARDHDLNPEHHRGRALEAAELRRLGQALDGDRNTMSAAAIRACLLAGCRPQEMRTLQWADLRDDGRRVELSAAKTGQRSLYLGRPAAEIIAAQQKVSRFVFPGRDPEKPMYDFKAVWARVKEQATLPEEVRLYDAGRHTFTTWALELGLPLDRVKVLIGHSTGDITARYTHYRNSVLLADADRIATALDSAMRGLTETHLGDSSKTSTSAGEESRARRSSPRRDRR